MAPFAGADVGGWDVEFVSEPFTLGSEDVDVALARLRARAESHRWDLVIGVAELPLRNDDGSDLLAALAAGSGRLPRTLACSPHRARPRQRHGRPRPVSDGGGVQAAP